MTSRKIPTPQSLQTKTPWLFQSGSGSKSLENPSIKTKKGGFSKDFGKKHLILKELQEKEYLFPNSDLLGMLAKDRRIILDLDGTVKTNHISTRLECSSSP